VEIQHVSARLESVIHRTAAEHGAGGEAFVVLLAPWEVFYTHVTGEFAFEVWAVFGDARYGALEVAENSTAKSYSGAHGRLRLGCEADGCIAL
jgi:hypothetical protein